MFRQVGLQAQCRGDDERRRRQSTRTSATNSCHDAGAAIQLPRWSPRRLLERVREVAFPRSASRSPSLGKPGLTTGSPRKGRRGPACGLPLHRRAVRVSRYESRRPCDGISIVPMKPPRVCASAETVAARATDLRHAVSVPQRHRPSMGDPGRHRANTVPIRWRWGRCSSPRDQRFVRHQAGVTDAALGVIVRGAKQQGARALGSLTMSQRLRRLRCPNDGFRSSTSADDVEWRKTRP